MSAPHNHNIITQCPHYHSLQPATSC